jgi:hypothetical protein
MLTLMLTLMMVGACSTDQAAQPSVMPKAGSSAGAGSGATAAAGRDAMGTLSGDAALAGIPAEMRPAELLPDLKEKLLVPDAASHGIAVFSDIVSVPAGGDIMFCTYTHVVTSAVMYIHESRGVQSESGHHAILQYTTTPQAPGTHPCAPDSLEAQQSQIIGGSGNEGTGAITLAPNVVSAVPAGAQLIINHHWINVGSTPIDVQAEMITIPPPAGQTDLIIARSFAVTTNSFNVPAHQSGKGSVDCTLKNDVSLLSVQGHQHEWGTRVKAERMATVPDTIFDHAYDPSMVNHPTIDYFPMEAPYQFKSGDTVRMSCEWNNTSANALTFPGEMCVLFGWQIGAEHDSVCFDGTWVQ